MSDPFTPSAAFPTPEHLALYEATKEAKEAILTLLTSSRNKLPDTPEVSKLFYVAASLRDGIIGLERMPEMDPIREAASELPREETVQTTPPTEAGKWEFRGAVKDAHYGPPGRPCPDWTHLGVWEHTHGLMGTFYDSNVGRFLENFQGEWRKPAAKAKTDFNFDYRPTMPHLSVATGTEARVCQFIAERQRVGLKKYGVSVEDNKLSQREWLEHLRAELADGLIYATRQLEEMGK